MSATIGTLPGAAIRGRADVLPITVPVTFHSADSHSYAFLLGPIGKYQNTITAVDGVTQAAITSWPLVDGPLLRSPDHDGYFEIRRHQDCPDALVLDFRIPAWPVITPPTSACNLGS